MFAVPENTVARATTAPTVHPALIARQYAEDRASWAHLLRYDPDERYTALVHRTPEQEVWLMSWLPGQATGLHDHGPSVGAFTIVSGELTEHVLRDGGTHRLVAGQSRVFAPGYLHEVGNEGADPAVSLHVYRATRTMTAYRALRNVS
ncbi:cysteine dioxygenase [Actinophytocola gossypii]|uniref:Cysteine dioxygenase family protein n=1 Tax=Actinophytocola gossypii TaxID=2812003 RepID=A0ABT2JAB6_9PSEU|nr:cysteine dioxygenase family protein [Actinophytocola gossypii]MCT2584797.1 cysteine dioxygenase family protein [Actinophytocola gossypii]